MIFICPAVSEDGGQRGDVRREQFARAQLQGTVQGNEEETETFDLRKSYSMARHFSGRLCSLVAFRVPAFAHTVVVLR